MSVVFLGPSAVHYESLGHGRPVVFLHTWLGTWRYWVPAMQLISGSHTAYAIDLFGFGDTARNPDAYSSEQQAALLEAFVDQMGMDRIALVGHGLGAEIGFSFVARTPGRIARMIAVAAALDPLSIDERLHGLPLEQLLALVGDRSAGWEQTLPSPTEIDRRAVDGALDFGRINAGVGGLRDSQAPLLLLYGADDPIVRPPAREHTLAIGPFVEQIVFSESGHFPMLDSAAPFERLLVDFLALEPGSSPRGLQPKEEWRRRIR